MAEGRKQKPHSRHSLQRRLTPSLALNSLSLPPALLNATKYATNNLYLCKYSISIHLPRCWETSFWVLKKIKKQINNFWCVMCIPCTGCRGYMWVEGKEVVQNKIMKWKLWQAATLLLVRVSLNFSVPCIKRLRIYKQWSSLCKYNIFINLYVIIYAIFWLFA